VLVCPKAPPLDWWWSVRPPRGVATLCTPYPADPRLAPMLRALCGPGVPAVFVGDMDPVSVAQYLAAKAMLRARNGPALLHGGINDSWLAAIPRSLKRPVTEVALRIPLDKPERRLWRQLEDSTDLEHLLGTEACRLLRSGYKVEIEAASNPALYNPVHQRWVFRYLRSLARARSGNGEQPQERGQA
jgi:hypothetical protein